VTTAGTWERAEDVARFTPRFAAVPGTELVVLTSAEDRKAGWRELARLTVPGVDREPQTMVETIDPSVDVIPVNLLRFSLAFSAAMEEGSASARLHLLDENGNELEGTLLEMPPELWDRPRRRLTVLLEPGRIKRGLQPHVRAGAPLRQGSTVTLVVDAEIRDARGAQLVEEARRRFRVGPPIRSRVDPALWDVTWPHAAGAPLVVRFDRPLDRALAQRYLRPIDGHGHPVGGHGSLDATHTQWVFTPDSDYSALQLHVDARLEDLAGNSVRRVFDRDLDSPEDDGIDNGAIILSAEN
jgi:hypothetical protein